MPTRAAKRSTSWVGDIRAADRNEAQQNGPHVITHVETTTAPVSDDARTAHIHAGLKQKELLPGQHLVDTSYVDAELLHSSEKDYGIDLVGPTRADYKWQAKPRTGFAASQFPIDWQAEQATLTEKDKQFRALDARDHRLFCG